jgi:hypothetical protein
MSKGVSFQYLRMLGFYTFSGGCLCYRDIDNLDILLRLFFVHFCVFDLVNNIQALDSSSKNRVLVVKPRLLNISFDA